jgi:hypothetical protein
MTINTFFQGLNAFSLASCLLLPCGVRPDSGSLLSAQTRHGSRSPRGAGADARLATTDGDAAAAVADRV